MRDYMITFLLGVTTIIMAVLAAKVAFADTSQEVRKCFKETPIVKTYFEWERESDLSLLEDCVNNALPKEGEPVDTRSVLERSISDNCRTTPFSKKFDETCVGYEIELFLARNACEARK